MMGGRWLRERTKTWSGCFQWSGSHQAILGFETPPSWSPLRHDGNPKPPVRDGAIWRSNTVSGYVCVRWYTILLLTCTGNPKNFFRNFVKVVSIRSLAALERFDCQTISPYVKIGRMYVWKRRNVKSRLSCLISTFLERKPMRALALATTIWTWWVKVSLVEKVIPR